MIRITDAKNVVITRTLDAYGRETATGLPGYGTSAPGSQTEFDVLDRVTSVSTTDGARTFDYSQGNLRVTDEKGRLTDQTRDAFGTPEDFRLSAIIQRSVPDQAGTVGDLEFRYTYNALDKLLSVAAFFNGASVADAGRAFSYESARPGLLTSETHPESGTTSYTYDVRARLATRTPSGLPAQTYSYDRAGRLWKVERPGDLENVEFQYDDRDNRTRQTTGFVDTSWAGTWPTG